jgi:hypothetical protein
MDLKSKRILEALQMQPLSQEEMTSRHILGRLYGPIATCIESTRNGRLYNKPLWEKALKDDIFLEKVATKALFLELGHPADREETDMKQACACIPEVPKIVGDDLYAYVDILDTPNGRLLKTLVDYGFVPGISSRGSGDVMDNNQVDPETFFLETWDIVQLPAVKKARLNVCESLDSENIKLKKALTESLNAAKEEDKDTMKKALENLNIDIEETDKETSETPVAEGAYDFADIPWDEEEEVLMEEMPADEDDSDETEETPDEPAEEPAEEVEEAEAEESTEDEEAESKEPSEEEGTVEVEDNDENEAGTIGEIVELLQEFDDDTEVGFELTQFDGKVSPVGEIDHYFDDDLLVLNVKACDEAEDYSPNADSNIETETEEPAVETIEEVDDSEESAEDNGDEEVIESLKEVVRQKEALETEVKDLRKAKSVGDAKEQELQEKLNRYRTAFKNTSAEAAKVPELQAQVKELTEKLAQQSNTIKTLTEQVNKAQQLKESIEGNKVNERRLNEEVSRLTEKSKTLEAKLEGQTKTYTEKLQERTNLAKAYKARFIETLTRYVESKANMLGVQPSEITSRLNESYTLKDVDAVCDKILESTVNFGRLPFGGRAKTSARIAESVSRPKNSYEEDDLSDLYELAGLKK